VVLNLAPSYTLLPVLPAGIDYTHPAFGGCTAINEPAGQCRVVAGKDLVGDEFVSGKDVQKPDNDPVSNLYLVGLCVNHSQD
jgi:hypothetical protein